MCVHVNLCACVDMPHYVGKQTTTQPQHVHQPHQGTETPAQYLKQLDGSSYAGFNLIVGDVTVPDFWYITNRGPHTTPRPLHPGVYGMSNGTIDDAWPKVGNG